MPRENRTWYFVVRVLIWLREAETLIFHGQNYLFVTSSISWYMPTRKHEHDILLFMFWFGFERLRHWYFTTNINLLEMILCWILVFSNLPLHTRLTMLFNNVCLPNPLANNNERIHWYLIRFWLILSHFPTYFRIITSIDIDVIKIQEYCIDQM